MRPTQHSSNTRVLVAPVPRCPLKGELGRQRPAAALVDDHLTGEVHLVPVVAVDIDPEATR